eukprot:686370-Prorocentrum_minimum.AAC.1
MVLHGRQLHPDHPEPCNSIGLSLDTEYACHPPSIPPTSYGRAPSQTPTAPPQPICCSRILVTVGTALPLLFPFHSNLGRIVPGTNQWCSGPSTPYLICLGGHRIQFSLEKSEFR